MAQFMPGELDPLQKYDLERRMKMAQALRQNQPQGQMVGNVFVAPSITQHLAAALSNFVGRKDEDAAVAEAKQQATQKQEKTASAAQRLAAALSGKTVDEPVGYMEAGGMPGITQTVQKPPTPQEIFQAQMQYGVDIGDQNTINTALTSAAQHGIKLDDRNFQIGREDEIYGRNRQDKLTDTAAEMEWQAKQTRDNQEFQRIMEKERQGFQLTQQEKTFAQQMAMQRDSQGFQAAQQSKAQWFQAGENAKNRAATVNNQRNKGLSVTAQKELIDAEDSIEGSKAAIDAFDKALALNNKAMGGVGAGALATVGTILPSSIRPSTVDATKELDNVLQGSALPQLKAIFGGMPTEGERAILLEVQGSSAQPASVRKGIFERAKAAAQKRIEYNKQKAQKLRSGTYFTEEGGIDVAPSPQPGMPSMDAIQAELARRRGGK